MSFLKNTIEHFMVKMVNYNKSTIFENIKQETSITDKVLFKKITKSGLVLSNAEFEKILLDLQKQLPIKIINMSRRFGTNPCVLAGFENCSGDCIIYMDSDLQDPPELIIDMVSKWKGGADCVSGVRNLRKKESYFKKITAN